MRCIGVKNRAKVVVLESGQVEPEIVEDSNFSVFDLQRVEFRVPIVVCIAHLVRAARVLELATGGSILLWLVEWEYPISVDRGLICYLHIRTIFGLSSDE
mgnify:CR=1 FL=1